MTYIAVTADRYELPMCIGDSATELAQLLEIPVKTVYTSAARGTALRKHYNGEKCRIVKLEKIT